jgi:glycosidase
MQWDDGPQAGFTSGTPWLKIPPSAAQTNVAKQAREASSILNFYRRLIALRRRSPALLSGDYASLGNDPHIFAYRRRGPTQTMLIALNMSKESSSLQLDKSILKESKPWRVVFSNRPASEGQEVKETLRLAPFEAVIVEARTK